MEKDYAVFPDCSNYAEGKIDLTEHEFSFFNISVPSRHGPLEKDDTISIYTFCDFDLSRIDTNGNGYPIVKAIGGFCATMDRHKAEKQIRNGCNLGLVRIICPRNRISTFYQDFVFIDHDLYMNVLTYNSQQETKFCYNECIVIDDDYAKFMCNI